MWTWRQVRTWRPAHSWRRRPACSWRRPAHYWRLPRPFCCPLEGCRSFVWEDLECQIKGFQGESVENKGISGGSTMENKGIPGEFYLSLIHVHVHVSTLLLDEIWTYPLAFCARSIPQNGFSTYPLAFGAPFPKSVSFSINLASASFFIALK